MMKTFGLVLGLMVVLAGAASAATIDLYGPGWNMVAAGQVPFDPNPANLFSTIPLAFPRLQRFDPIGQSSVQYDPDDPEGSGFGNILLGDGYLLYTDSPTQITFAAVPDGVPDAANVGTDMWISLPGQKEIPTNLDAGGYHLIGCPFGTKTDGTPHDVSLDKIFFTDGTAVKNWADAMAANWVTDKMQYLVADGQSGAFLYYDGSGDDDTMRAGRAYWVQTLKDDIAMIVLAQ